MDWWREPDRDAVTAPVPDPVQADSAAVASSGDLQKRVASSVVMAVLAIYYSLALFATGFKLYDISADAVAGTVAWAIGAHRDHPQAFRAMQVRAMKSAEDNGAASARLLSLR